MRALISWDVERTDPEFQRILMAIGDCFPERKLTPLTNQTAVVGPISVRQFDRSNLRLQSVATQFAGRFFYVFSLHSDDDPIFGVFRSAGPAAGEVVALGPSE